MMMKALTRRIVGQSVEHRCWEALQGHLVLCTNSKPLQENAGCENASLSAV